MPSKATFQSIDAAIVRLPGLGGHGVLIAGGYILTAAHCVHHYNSGGMALGDDCMENVRTGSGLGFNLAVVAVEPVSDIAVLGEPDNQKFFGDAEKFDQFREEVQPVSLQHIRLRKATDTPSGYTLDVWARNLRGRWISAQARLLNASSHVAWIAFSEPIESGMAGGPIVDSEGNLFAIVSNGAKEGFGPRPLLSLPAWLARKIGFAESVGDGDQSRETIKGK